MSTWIVYHNDETHSKIEADSVSVAGTVLAFLKHSLIETPDGKIQGIPVAFTDLTNPTVKLVEMVPEEEVEDAPVLALV